MIADRKAALRRELSQRRKELRLEDHAKFSLMAARQLLRNFDLPASGAVSLFWPLGAEVDTRPLLGAIDSLGIPILLPRTRARAEPLSFHLWSNDQRLEKSTFGVEEPPSDAPSFDPELMVVPLLGFDSACYRLGYGAGHYDCTLSDMKKRGLSPKTIGLAFECQRVEQVPREPHDRRLDAIVTESAMQLPE